MTAGSSRVPARGPFRIREARSYIRTFVLSYAFRIRVHSAMDRRMQAVIHSDDPMMASWKPIGPGSPVANHQALWLLLGDSAEVLF